MNNLPLEVEVTYLGEKEKCYNMDVRVFLGDKQIKSDELSKLKIKNASIDRIVNDVVDRNKVKCDNAKSA